MNNRHRAAMNDDGGGKFTLQQLIKVIRAAQYDLEQNDDSDGAALRFEILGDYLEEEVAKFGKPLTYTSKMIGL